MQDEYKDVPEGVIAADFYHSNDLMALSDEDIVQRVHDTLKICEPGFRDAKVSCPIWLSVSLKVAGRMSVAISSALSHAPREAARSCGLLDNLFRLHVASIVSHTRKMVS